MLLFSSRANPEAVVDIFSDYDILLAVTDVHRFHSEDRWLEEFGKVLIYTAYLACRPTEPDYLAVIEEFFNDSIYVAKHL